MQMQDFKMDFFSLKGRNAVITGGNGGLGQAFSRALAEAGANIFIPSIIEEDNGTRQLIEETGVKYYFMKSDITAKGEPKKIIETCVKEFGSIDILVNCAGICKLNDVLDFTRDDWDPMIAVNLTAAFELSHEAAKFMIPQKSGKIINIASLFTFLGGLASPAYAATKHGLAGFTKAYADELGKYNIQVNCIAPGYFATDITAATRSDPVKNETILRHIPAERWGWVSDLMGPTVFLASRASDYVTGTTVVVDGGYLVR